MKQFDTIKAGMTGIILEIYNKDEVEAEFVNQMAQIMNTMVKRFLQ